jgi:hypothetical protein
MKLTKEQYDALPAELKKLFTKDGDNYTMEQPEDTGALKRALEREREDKQKLKDDLKTFKDDLAAIKAEKEEADRKKATDSKDIDAINASWQKKLDKVTADKDAVIAAREGSLRQLLVTNEAQRLANDMSTAPDLLVPFIERRLQADFSQDGKATTRVLDADGKLSALSLGELQKEMLADKRFSTILKASNASGGGASGGAGGGGASNLKAYRNADGTTNWSKVNEGMKTNPELLQQIKEFNADPANTP